MSADAIERIGVKIEGSILELVRGDITRQDTEAVVNAANGELAPGGGVAGAIHRAAGPALWEECRKLGGCATGEAKITAGHGLPNKFVIHTVGPVYSGSPRDAELLRKCYQNSLNLAAERRIRSISFPALSTGIFGYPVEEAARVALRAIVDFLREPGNPVELVRMVLYDPRGFAVHRQALSEISGPGDVNTRNPKNKE